MNDLNRKTILLVENDPLIAQTQIEVISQFGYYVIHSSTGESAIELVKSNEDINLILTDINLGSGIDGAEAARIINSNHNIPIIFLTSHSEKEIVKKIKGITHYGYVIKNSGEFVLHSSIEMAFDLFEARVKTLYNEEKYKVSEKKIKKLNRVYLLLSNIYKSIVHTRDKQILMDEVCRIAIDDGKFIMSWIGIINPYTNIVEEASSGGHIGNYLETINIDLNDENRSQGPTGQSIKKETYIVCNDIENDSRMIPWRENAIKHGFKSSISLPLILDKKVIGSFTFYSNEINFFDDEEIKLLNGLATDISFALDFYDKEIKRKKSEEENKNLLKEKDLLMKEVHHRIKNNMSSIISLLSLHSDIISDPFAQSALLDAQTRVQSMVVLYDKLYRSSNYRHIPIKGYLNSLLDEIINNFPNKNKVHVQKQIDDFMIDANKIFHLGIILNEIITNIMKYAFIDRANGLILVSATLINKNATLIIQDDGVGINETINFENSSGFGIQLIHLLTQQIQGTIKLERNNGTRIILEFEV